MIIEIILILIMSWLFAITIMVKKISDHSLFISNVVNDILVGMIDIIKIIKEELKK
mgnify:FL=1|jgi:hypothetical protein